MSLEEMSPLGDVLEALQAIEKTLLLVNPLINCHLNSFFTDSLWERCLGQKLRVELDKMSLDEVKDAVTTLTTDLDSRQSASDEVVVDETEFVDKTFAGVVEHIQRLMLPNLRLTKDYCGDKDVSRMFSGLKISGRCARSQEVWKETQSGQESCSSRSMSMGEPCWSWKCDPFMSHKKKHEVLVLSEFIATLAATCSQLNITSDELEKADGTQIFPDSYLIDLGSGKGYLSSFLSYAHNFNVLALESSSTNINGCNLRSSKLQKSWTSAAKRTKEGQSSTNDNQRHGKHWKSRKRSGSDAAATNVNACNGIQHENASCEDSRNPNVRLTQEEVKFMADVKPVDNQHSDDKLKTVNMVVHENINLCELLDFNFQRSSNTNSPGLGIIGLHTCGQLGVDSVKLFSASKDVQFLVNVPCCYHLINEEYELENPEFERANSDFGNPFPGFPLCSTLKQHRFYLGRNARMMSSQSLHRISADPSAVFSQALLFRAMLQVLLKQKLGRIPSEKRVGRIGAKHEHFPSYTWAAWKKLGLEDVAVSNEEIENLLETFLPERERFYKFILFRSFFAPLIEGFILLDRLAYLLEQETTCDASIVKLFDPFCSPRCYAVVAVK